MTIGYSRTHTRMPIVYNYVRIHMLSSHFVNAAAGRAGRETLAAICGTSWGTCHMRYLLKRIGSLCLLLDRPSNSLTLDRRPQCPRRGAPFLGPYTQGLNRPACHQKIEGLSVSRCQWHYAMTKRDDWFRTRLKSRLRISCTVYSTS